MKLVVNGQEVEPSKKVKLYRVITPSRSKKILEDPEELQKLKAELETSPENG